ncbi:MAG: PQQ-binding-like beta-propeller repeat protein [Kofleriaceae bacterium]|nr:PQQ-binding-like beta-propeller repeat protein [Kofleriaceae bacterium]
MPARTLAVPTCVLVALIAVCSLTSRARADEFGAPRDRHVICLDEHTGVSRWEVPLAHQGRAELAIVDGRLLVSAVGSARPERHVLELSTGGASARIIDPDAPRSMSVRFDRPRAWRGRDLTGPTGAGFRVAHPAGGPARRVERWPDELVVLGDLAIFGLAGTSTDAWQGQVFGYDLGQRREVWRTSVVPPGLVMRDSRRTGFYDHGYTGVWADAGAVYVMFDQVLTALAPATGKMMWQQVIRQQALRRHDVGRMQLRRLGDRLLVTLYEGLFLLDAATGALRWWYGTGDPAGPQPVIGGGLVCLVRRGRAYVVDPTVDLSNENENMNGMGGRILPPPAAPTPTRTPTTKRRR